MKRFGAWFLFVLACVLPGWYLRDIAAAEAQMRYPLCCTTTYRKLTGWREFFLHPQIRWVCGRALSIRGQEHLWGVMHSPPDSERRRHAASLLYDYDTPAIDDWCIGTLSDPDPWVRKAAAERLGWRATAVRGASPLRNVSEDGLLEILRASSSRDDRHGMFWSMWMSQPDAAERAAIRWVRETRDSDAVWWAFCCPLFPDRLNRRVGTEADLDRVPTARRRILLAGLLSADTGIRHRCSEALVQMGLLSAIHLGW